MIYSIVDIGKKVFDKDTDHSQKNQILHLEIGKMGI